MVEFEKQIQSKLTINFYNRSVLTVAKELLGCIFVRKFPFGYVFSKIVETEAYHEWGDPSCHAHKGKTKRNEIMFGPPGRLYVYFTYGMHYCMNIVTEKEGIASAVLIRALEPIYNYEIFYEYFPNKKMTEWMNGPAKICKALQISKEHNGLDVTTSSEIFCIQGDKVPKSKIKATTRIGISKGKELLWRFIIKDSPFISK